MASVASLKNMADAVKNPAQGQGNLAEELKEKKANIAGAFGPASTAATASKPPASSPADRIRPTAKYGDNAGEKRIDVSGMVKPLGKMHDGGEVPKTGAYIMKKGEHVLTPEKKNLMHHAMSLAETALSHPDTEDKEPEPPKKEIREMRIRKGASGGYVIEHHHTHFSHPMEEHTAKDTDDLHDHLEQHMGEPNDGEGNHEESGESTGAQAAEAALGYK